MSFGIKNVIFDVGNVLIDFCWRRHMENLGFSQDAVETLREKMVECSLWDDLDRGVRPENEVIEDMKAAAPEYLPHIEAFWAQPQGMVHVREQSAPWLCDLHERGFGVYILSNYPHTLWTLHSPRFNFLQYTDGAVVSSTEKIMKPAAEIYTRLLDRFGLKAEECAFVDDRAVNTQAAEQLGIRSVLYRDAQQAQNDLDALLGIKR